MALFQIGEKRAYSPRVNQPPCSVGSETELFCEQGKIGAHDLVHVVVTVLGNKDRHRIWDGP